MPLNYDIHGSQTLEYQFKLILNHQLLLVISENSYRQNLTSFIKIV